jgi:predicted ATPase
MKLLKVHVHNYRHLKDVSLTFEPDLYPQVFAIGSENGGGKSTLLQLIFTFLHCTPHSKLHKFAVNAIQHMKSSLEYWEEKIYQIIDMDFLDKDGKNISISYLLYPVSSQEPENHENLSINDAIHLLRKAELLKKQIIASQSKKKTLESNLKGFVVSNIEDKNRKQELQSNLKNIREELTILQEILGDMPINEYNQILLKEDLELLLFLKLPNLDKVSNYCLCCKLKSDSSLIGNDILTNISKNILLAGQTTQPYIFLSDDSIGDMFNTDKIYEQTLENARLEIGNLYNFNAFAIYEIIDAFKTAIEEDTKSMIENGYYGSNFSELSKELKLLLGGNKEIIPTPDREGLTVRYYFDGKNYKELSLGELSHGELKRVCLYSWIRHNKASQSIVLIDEIENGLHPDWQYQIVKDLQEWGDNQYILATHSFYLCEALTPRHVKELAPKMSQPILNK